DQAETLLGQGTLALELLEQAPDLDTILVGVGGGGLVGGIAAWCGGRVRVVGVEPEGAPTLTAALAAGEPVDAPTGSVAADPLSRAGRVDRIGDLAEDAIATGVRAAARRVRPRNARERERCEEACDGSRHRALLGDGARRVALPVVLQRDPVDLGQVVARPV